MLFLLNLSLTKDNLYFQKSQVENHKNRFFSAKNASIRDFRLKMASHQLCQYETRTRLLEGLKKDGVKIRDIESESRQNTDREK